MKHAEKLPVVKDGMEGDVHKRLCCGAEGTPTQLWTLGL